MGCCDGEIVVYACSGCADVGQVSDLISRKLRKDGLAKATSSCLAGIGAKIQNFIDVAKTAQEVITIDGCGILCARKMIEQINVTPKAYVLTEMGLEKGKTAITEEIVTEYYNKIIQDASLDKPRGCC
jgi:uncharacterized metal-binding protein